MKVIIYIFLALVILTSSCRKLTQSNFECELGCVDFKNNEINNIPYLTNSEKLLAAISTNKDIEIYKADGKTVTSTIEDNCLLGVLKNNGKVKEYYALNKQDVQECIVNGDPTSMKLDSECGDVNTSKATAKTAYFDAKKDSIYDIYATSYDSAHGSGWFSVTDNTGNIYLDNEPAGTTTGWKLADDKSTDPSYGRAKLYTITSNVTGKIYVEAYGLYKNPVEPKYLSSDFDLWVRTH